MKTNLICPISINRIDENAARINAIQTFILLLVFYFTYSAVPIFILLADFMFRAAEKSELSPLTIISKKIKLTFNLKPKFINAGPKIFAARIGLLFAFIVAFFQAMGFETLSLVFAGTFGLFVFLEAAFGFCVACKVYPLIYKFSLKFQ